MRIGMLEPHLLRFGGIRRMVELANRLVARGHHVTFYLPDGERLRCDWMRCDADVRGIGSGLDDALDVLLFNEETQWHQLERFTRARRRVFYALHAAWHYDKAATWEACRAPVDLQLANSRWTADQLERETGHRPPVVPTGINRQQFHPVDVRPRYPILCVGDHRGWKGTALIHEAATLLGLPVEEYAHKHLRQDQLAREYRKAEVFVVGSRAEGFGHPGLEALACGVPLVTTDNGGCREYAVDGETALVVPPDDPESMAAAIKRVRGDAELRQRLTTNGLATAARFDWDRAAEEMEAHLQQVCDDPAPRPLELAPNRRETSEHPQLSVIVAQWDQRHHTQRCVESIRRNTDVPYELVLVDNGSGADAAAYASQAADVPVLNETNLGFAGGMNAGLQRARGRWVAFVNNDTRLPPRWASPLIESLEADGRRALAVPAVTVAGNQHTVRQEPGTTVEHLPRFESPPSAVLYLLDRHLVESLGAWGEEFPVASAEDIDLCFKLWVNDRDIVFDSRVLVEHVGKGTAGPKLGDYETRWAANRRVLFDKWTAPDPDVPRLPDCPEDDFQRNLDVARSVAGWMQRYFTARDRLPRVRAIRVVVRLGRPVIVRSARFVRARRQSPIMLAARRLLARLPRVERRLLRLTDLG